MQVYSIFTAQALTTVAVVSFILSQPSISHFLITNSDLVLLGTSVGMIGTAGSLTLSSRLRYHFPLNLLVLGIYTLCQSTILGTVTSTMNQKLVCAGSMHTLIVFLGMTLFAFQPNPKYDLTPFGTLLLNSLLGLTVGVIASAFFRIPLTSSLISGLSAVLFSVYIAYDTQLIVGGKHKKRAYNQKEYILAVLGLYQDAVSLFLTIMRILNATDRNSNRSSRSNNNNTNKEDS